MRDLGRFPAAGEAFDGHDVLLLERDTDQSFLLVNLQLCRTGGLVEIVTVVLIFFDQPGSVIFEMGGGLLIELGLQKISG